MKDDQLNIELNIEKKPVNQRAADEKMNLINRLKRIEGQVRGIQKMIEDDRYCVDTLVQLSAVNAALRKVAFSLLEDHTRGCVTGAIKSGHEDEAIKELMKVIQQFSK
ncbi:metal-sensing transcriptional repressor [Anaerobacillus sp. MEB173]|uniref:metal-sensing transcriptional repressor n=1 Tax=Anaerobacillus sp. MEB173 TaxID=3383345 RepID=UPI003F927766